MSHRLITTNLYPPIRQGNHFSVTNCSTYIHINVYIQWDRKWNWIKAWIIISSEGKSAVVSFQWSFAPSVYLILVRATALLSVFWNKARIRFFTSELENSNASGPLPSAHLRRGITDKSVNRTHRREKQYDGNQAPFFFCGCLTWQTLSQDISALAASILTTLWLYIITYWYVIVKFGSYLSTISCRLARSTMTSSLKVLHFFT